MSAKTTANKVALMLDESGPSVIGWMDQHSGFLGLLLGAVVMVAGWLVMFARYGFRLNTAEADLTELKTRIATAEDDLTEHITNTRRHIDPERDERRWLDLKEQLQRIETKVDSWNR